MALVLPSSVDYKQALPALPDATKCISVAASPTNGQTFSSGQQIYFDLLNRGFLVPDSMYISYSYSVDSSGVTGWRGTPVYSAFNRLDVQIGSQTADTIQNYGLVMHMLTNTQYDVAQKYGLQACFLYDPSSATVVPTLEELDGKVLANGVSTGTGAAPLVSLLSNAEKLIPLFAMPQVRIILTMDSLSNQFTAIGAGSSVKSFSISNVELRYKVVDMGGGVENVVLSMGDKLYIKSQSFACATQTLPVSSGSVELVYNQRFASVKSVYGLHGATDVSGVNGIYDSYDITGSAGGDYAFRIGGENYPQKPISTRTNKAGALMELKSAVGSIFDKSNNLSINRNEFYLNLGTVSTITQPAKFYIGTSTEKLNSDSLLTGVSTQNSPISYAINIGTQMPSASAVSLVINYDALLEVDTMTRQASVKA